MIDTDNQQRQVAGHATVWGLDVHCSTPGSSQQAWHVGALEEAFVSLLRVTL